VHDDMITGVTMHIHLDKVITVMMMTVMMIVMMVMMAGRGRGVRCM
jgi:hypothetical protein